MEDFREYEAFKQDRANRNNLREDLQRATDKEQGRDQYIPGQSKKVDFKQRMSTEDSQVLREMSPERPTRDHGFGGKDAPCLHTFDQCPKPTKPRTNQRCVIDIEGDEPEESIANRVKNSLDRGQKLKKRMDEALEPGVLGEEAWSDLHGPH